MRRLPLALGLLVLSAFTASTASAQKQYGFDNRKGSGQPYLKPEESVAKFKVAPEFEVKLFAGEPNVVNPIAFTIDEKGRVWVVECFEYPKRTPKGKAPRDRIVILEDTDGDGVCDRRTVFAEGKDFPVPEERKKAGLGAFDLASGIEVGHGGVFVGAPPYLWFIENKNDRPGKFEVLLSGFGSQDTHEMLNTFQWGPDGWLYGLHGVFTNSNIEVENPSPSNPSPGPSRKKGGEKDRTPPSLLGKGAGGLGSPTRMNAAVWRYHPKTRKFEIFAEGTSNPWGMDWRNTDGQFILCCCVIPHLFHIVPGGIYKRQAGASFNPYVYGYLDEICDHTFHKESGWAHAGLIALDAPHIPKKYQNSVIFGSIHGCSIKQNILKPNGSTFTASRGDDFLVSDDKNFRPINMKWGPLGDIYLIDWHDQNPCHQTAPDLWDYERGRVYRIQLKGTKPKKAEDLGEKSGEDLVNLIDAKPTIDGKRAQPTPYHVRTALRLVHERIQKDPMDESIIKALQAATQSLASFSAFIQVRAKNWKGLSGPLDLKEIRKLDDPKYPFLIPIIRAVAEHEATKDETIKELTDIASDGFSVSSRRELASAAIRLADRHDVTPLLRALMSHKEDVKDPVIPQLVWLAYEKVLSAKAGAASPAEKELAWLAEQASENPFVRDQIIPKVMRRLVATGQPEDLKLCIEFVAKVKDAASREKALEGLATALANQTVATPAEWTALQAEIAKDNNPKLTALANKLAVSFRDPEAVKRAVAAATNLKLPVAARTEAIRQIAVLKADKLDQLLLDLLRDDKEIAVRAEAARALAAFNSASIPNELLKSWKELPKEVHADVVNTLATRREWAKALLSAMADKTIERAAVTDNTILRIQAFKDKELNSLIEKAWGRTRPTPAELTKTIDKARESLYEAPASFARGRVVFENTCGKCHKFDGKGADVGPALEGAARDIEYILGNVIDPNRVIGAPYFLRTARLLDGTIQQGVLAEEDDKSVTLKLENGVIKKIAKDDLESPLQTVEKSLMPEGLGYNMTAQDFRDLVRYVMANPFLTDVTVNGKKVSVGVPGRIPVPQEGRPVAIEAEVTAPEELKTTLLIGSSADFKVKLNGHVVGNGRGTGKQVQPDQASIAVVLPKGTSTVAVIAKGSGMVYARFADPNRKLRYPDVGEKKE